MYLDPLAYKHMREKLSFWRGTSALLAVVLFIMICALMAHGW